jgi:hypothetical protein
MRSLMEMSQKQHFTKYGFWAYKDESANVTRVYTYDRKFFIHIFMYQLNLAPGLPVIFYKATLESFGDKETP